VGSAQARACARSQARLWRLWRRQAIVSDAVSPDPEFIAAVAAAVESVRIMREKLAAVGRVPIALKPAPVIVATLADPSVARGLGQIANIGDWTSKVARDYMTQSIAAFSTIEECRVFGERVGDGMADTALDCPCGGCSFCQARAADSANAEREIRKAMASAVTFTPFEEPN
jgi:hypothetical protein